MLLLSKPVQKHDQGGVFSPQSVIAHRIEAKGLHLSLLSAIFVSFGSHLPYGRCSNSCNSRIKALIVDVLVEIRGNFFASRNVFRIYEYRFSIDGRTIGNCVTLQKAHARPVPKLLVQPPMLIGRLFRFKRDPLSNDPHIAATHASWCWILRKAWLKWGFGLF